MRGRGSPVAESEKMIVSAQKNLNDAAVVPGLHKEIEEKDNDHSKQRRTVISVKSPEGTQISMYTNPNMTCSTTNKFYASPKSSHKNRESTQFNHTT
jgi:beta-lactam-binding protein with PASTA domain